MKPSRIAAARASEAAATNKRATDKEAAALERALSKVCLELADAAAIALNGFATKGVEAIQRAAYRKHIKAEYARKFPKGSAIQAEDEAISLPLIRGHQPQNAAPNSLLRCPQESAPRPTPLHQGLISALQPSPLTSAARTQQCSSELYPSAQLTHQCPSELYPSA